MTVDALMEIINLAFIISLPISNLLLLWQIFLFIRERKKKEWKLKKERKIALLRWLTGVFLIFSSYSLTNLFASMILGDYSESGMSMANYLTSYEPSTTEGFMSFVFGGDFTTTGIVTMILVILSGLMFLLSSEWSKLRHAGHGLFWMSLVYVFIRVSQVIFPSGANVYEVYANLADSYLGFFGGLFFLLTIIFTVKGLLAYDHKQPRKVKKNLEKMLQLCIGLVFLVISTGLMRSIALSFDVPETMKSFLLDTDSAAYRYSMLLYLFGSFIYLRQVFPYFRYGLMGLLSLSGAYLVFDLVNYIV